jgi:hypothetical protein
MTKYRVGRDVDLKKEDVRLSSGKRLTEEQAARIADETLKAIGRPSLTAPGRRSPRVTVRLPEGVMKAVEEAARREGRTVSEVTREAVQEYVAKRSTKRPRGRRQKA